VHLLSELALKITFRGECSLPRAQSATKEGFVALLAEQVALHLACVGADCIVSFVVVHFAFDFVHCQLLFVAVEYFIMFGSV
jgi:hypothetical protein